MRKNSGFTIIELLIAVAIVAILVSIAVPSLISWRQKAQLGGFAREVYGLFQKAKMEATRQNRDYTVAFGHADCDYVLFFDANSNQAFDPPGETAVHCIDKSDFPGVSDSFVGFTGSYIIFANNGLAKRADMLPPGGEVHLTMNGRESVVSVSLTGNVKIEKYAE